MKTASGIVNTLARTMDSQRKSSEEWRTIVDSVRFWQEKDGIDDALPRFAEYVAKIAKGELRSSVSDKPQGLMLIGGIGSGKTKRADFMERRLGIHMQTAAELVGRISRHADDVEVFREITRTDRKWGFETPKRYYDLIIDDLGREESETVSYGTRRDIMERVIEARYMAYENFGDITHFTTNLNAEDIGRRYGERILSRLSLMCVFVVMPGGDRRRAGRRIGQ